MGRAVHRARRRREGPARHARRDRPEDAVISIHTPDVEGVYEEAQRLGYEIVHPLTIEPWGVHRFLVRAPDGNVVNVVQHSD